MPPPPPLSLSPSHPPAPADTSLWHLLLDEMNISMEKADRSETMRRQLALFGALIAVLIGWSAFIWLGVVEGIVALTVLSVLGCGLWALLSMAYAACCVHRTVSRAHAAEVAEIAARFKLAFGSTGLVIGAGVGTYTMVLPRCARASLLTVDVPFLRVSAPSAAGAGADDAAGAEADGAAAVPAAPVHPPLTALADAAV